MALSGPKVPGERVGSIPKNTTFLFQEALSAEIRYESVRPLHRSGRSGGGSMVISRRLPLFLNRPLHRPKSMSRLDVPAHRLYPKSGALPGCQRWRRWYGMLCKSQGAAGASGGLLLLLRGWRLSCPRSGFRDEAVWSLTKCQDK